MEEINKEAIAILRELREIDCTGIRCEDCLLGRSDMCLPLCNLVDHKLKKFEGEC